MTSVAAGPSGLFTAIGFVSAGLSWMSTAIGPELKSLRLVLSADAGLDPGCDPEPEITPPTRRRGEWPTDGRQFRSASTSGTT